ncbi:MAG: acyltransferase family protein, partial [Nostoc sp. C3-bin3]|nr:acyltransferase family protein [Nostoc sp. C3-bin3]
MAIVLVVIGHVIGNKRDAGILQMYDSDIPLLAGLTEFIYTFHMPIFFILSGVSFATFSKKNNSLLSFLNSKFKRLLVPLLCWAPILLIFQSLSKGVHVSFLDLIN